MRRPYAILCAALLGLLAAPLAHAHPEFQKFLAETAPRNADCAMCHRHPDGPEGLKPGQIGSLEPEDIEKLQQARAAFEPGRHVDNPLLNAFGNDIVRQVGKRELLKMRQDPARLAAALDPRGDLDGDGVSDPDEYLAGTHPVDPQSGPPWQLFLHNLKAAKLHIVLIIVATIAGIYGLGNLLHWFELAFARDDPDDSHVHPA